MLDGLLVLGILLPPFVAAGLVMVLPDRRGLCWATTVAGVVLSLLFLVLASTCARPRPVIVDVGGLKGLIGFHVDGAGLVLAYVVLVVGLAILVYSYSYISPGNREHPVSRGYVRYYSLMSLFVGSMLGVALAYSWPTLLLFYEMTGICSCLLIAYYGDRESTRAAVQALVLTHVGGLALTLAIVLVYAGGGSLLLPGVSRLSRGAAELVGLLVLVACLAKSAQLPFHFWLPDAMVAPTTVSAYLHAAAMVKVGVFTFIRFIQYAPQLWGHSSLLTVAALGIGLATMWYAAVMYFAQRDLKRLLAYSTIAQLSYILVASCFTLAGAGDGISVALYHLWNHSYSKALLFLAVGALAYATGGRSFTDAYGVARRPGLAIIAASWLLGGFSLAGIPPLACFYSKLAIVVQGFRGPLVTIASAVLVIAESMLCLVVFSYICYKMFFAEPHTASAPLARVPKAMAASLAFLGAMTLIAPYTIPFPVAG